MPRLLTVAAALFWLLPLGLALAKWYQRGFFHADLYYLLGVPLLMLPTTILSGQIPDTRFRGLILSSASFIAFFAAILWASIWGRDV